MLIYSDDQGTLDARCFGSDDLHTPSIDRLASQGVRFTQAYSHTVCCPARAMLMTGRYPLRTGAASVTRGLETVRSEEVTIAEVLKRVGYRTGIFGKWHLGDQPEFQG